MCALGGCISYLRQLLLDRWGLPLHVLAQGSASTLHHLLSMPCSSPCQLGRLHIVHSQGAMALSHAQLIMIAHLSIIPDAVQQPAQKLMLHAVFSAPLETQQVPSLSLKRRAQSSAVPCRSVVPLKRLEALPGCPALLGAAAPTAGDLSAAQQGPEFMAMDGAALENLEVCCPQLWGSLLLSPWAPPGAVSWLMSGRSLCCCPDGQTLAVDGSSSL